MSLISFVNKIKWMMEGSYVPDIWRKRPDSLSALGSSSWTECSSIFLIQLPFRRTSSTSLRNGCILRRSPRLTSPTTKSFSVQFCVSLIPHFCVILVPHLTKQCIVWLNCRHVLSLYTPLFCSSKLKTKCTISKIYNSSILGIQHNFQSWFSYYMFI